MLAEMDSEKAYFALKDLGALRRLIRASVEALKQAGQGELGRRLDTSERNL